VLALADFVKSLVVEVVGAIIAYFLIIIIGYYWNPSLMEMEISLGMLIVFIAFITIGFFVFYRVLIRGMSVQATYGIDASSRARVEPSRKGAKVFSCLECGEPFNAFPPDEIYIVGKREQSSTDVIIIKYTCVNGHENDILWHPQRGVVA